MPHITIKTYPLPETVKLELAKEITNLLINKAGKSENAISIAITDVPESDWMEQVYDREIRPNLSTLYKKPGY